VIQINIGNTCNMYDQDKMIMLQTINVCTSMVTLRIQNNLSDHVNTRNEMLY
jgi:hypothetical protein